MFWSAIKEITEMIIFKTMTALTKIISLPKILPLLNNAYQINLYNDEIDQCEEEVVRDNNSGEEFIKDYEKAMMDITTMI